MTGKAAPGKVVKLLTPGEVAALFRVDPKTVTRWAKAGKLSFTRTLQGHRRYLEDEVMALLREGHHSRRVEQPKPVGTGPDPIGLAKSS